MKRFAKIFWACVLVVITAVLLDFIAINAMLGCESWDHEQWTASHSCVAPSDLWRTVK